MGNDIDTVIARLIGAETRELEEALFSKGPLMSSEVGSMLLALALEIQRLRNTLAESGS